jgi:dTDP-4-amino-4,6-dideoxygalactose transaminase
MLLPQSSWRERFLDHLGQRGILGVFHYLPLHVSDMGRRYGGREGDCPVAEDISNRLVRLPFFNSLSESEQGEVIEAVASFRGSPG